MATKKKTEKPIETTTKPAGKAEKIWNSIKNIDLNMFSLPGQTIEKYCQRDEGMEIVFPDELHVKIAVSAVIPVMEEVLQKTHAFSSRGEYTVITER